VILVRTLTRIDAGVLRCAALLGHEKWQDEVKHLAWTTLALNAELCMVYIPCVQCYNDCLALLAGLFCPNFTVAKRLRHAFEPLR